MLSEELRNIQAGLGKLLGKLDPESADFLRRARRNLDEAAEQAENLENHIYPNEAV